MCGWGGRTGWEGEVTREEGEVATARAPPAADVAGAAASGREYLAAFLFICVLRGKEMSPSVGCALLQCSFAAPESALPARDLVTLASTHPHPVSPQGSGHQGLRNNVERRLLCAPPGRARALVEGGRAISWQEQLAWVLSLPQRFPTQSALLKEATPRGSRL